MATRSDASSMLLKRLNAQRVTMGNLKAIFSVQNDRALEDRSFERSIVAIAEIYKGTTQDFRIAVSFRLTTMGTLLAQGVRPMMILLEDGIPPERVLEREAFWIARSLREAHSLTNGAGRPEASEVNGRARFLREGILRC
jgi:hypothetical protein